MANVKSLTVNGIKYDIKDAAARTAIAGKQDALTAGSNITITGNTISAIDTTYTAGENITIENGVISATGGGGNGGNSLLDFKWLDYELNDMSWVRADTFSWLDSDVYQVAYQHLASDISGKTLRTETISGITISFYLASDGHKICPASQEAIVSSIYAATGIAWYYIIDTTNRRFKLPRTKFAFTGLRDTVGKYVEAGLPNIEAFVQGARRTYDVTTTGAIRWSGYEAKKAGSSGGNVSVTDHEHFNASWSNSIYGNSDTVQAPATQMYLYFFVGNFTQTALENTAGVTATTLNKKAGINLDNITTTGKRTVINWSMPDYDAGVTISTAVGGTFTMPVDAYLFARCGGQSRIAVYKDNSSGTHLTYLESTGTDTFSDHLFVEKGTVLYIAYRNGSYAELYYYPLKGN